MNIFFTLLIALSVLAPAAFGHEGPSLVEDKGCEALLEDKNYWDLSQSDDKINDELLRAGIIEKTRNDFRLCGPTCVANAILGKSGPYSQGLQGTLVSELKNVIQDAILDLRLPAEAILRGAYSGDVGQLLAASIRRNKKVVPEMLYLGAVRFADSRTSPHFPVPQWITGTKKISLEDLKRTNQKNATMIAMIFIDVPDGPSWGHFVIFERIFQSKGHTYAFIRDPAPSSGLARYWVELTPTQEYELSSFTLTPTELWRQALPAFYQPQNATVYLRAAMLATWPNQ